MNETSNDNNNQEIGFTFEISDEAKCFLDMVAEEALIQLSVDLRKNCEKYKRIINPDDDTAKSNKIPKSTNKSVLNDNILAYKEGESPSQLSLPIILPYGDDGLKKKTIKRKQKVLPHN